MLNFLQAIQRRVLTIAGNIERQFWATVKLVITASVKHFGYQLTPIHNNPGHHLDLNRALKLRINLQTPVVLDVGANIGQSADWILTLFPGAYIFCFEPHEAAFAELAAHFSKSPSVRCIRCAVGDINGLCELFENTRSVTSSLLAAAGANVDNQFQPLRTTSVAMCRLDRFIRDNELSRIDLLKIDVQGYEECVLSGLGDLLSPKIVGAIYLELNFVDYYIGQADPGRIVSELRSRGYKLYGLYDVHANYTDGMTYSDALFFPIGEVPRDVQ